MPRSYKIEKPALKAGKVEPLNLTINAVSFASYWVGVGTYGSKKFPKRRRFLRARDEKGLCRYFLWTEPDKGEPVILVRRFLRRVYITEEFARNHFNK